MSLKPLTPPLRFSTVAFSCVDDPSNTEDDPRLHSHHRESVYRGAYPKSRNLYFLSRLHLRTVLSLTPRPLDNDAALLAWSSQSDPSPLLSTPTTPVAERPAQMGIKLLHVRSEKPKDESGGLTREGAARALSILLDRRNHPIYVHCLDGVEVTSTLVACMRKVQAWSNPAILAELGRALRDSNSSEWTEVPSYLSSFLNKFAQPDGIRLPPRNHIPSWLWPAPNPLSILANPYAWAVTSHIHNLANGNNHNGAGSSSNSIVEDSMSRNTSLPPSSEQNDNIALPPRVSPQPSIHPHLHRNRQLPIHHPTLKLHFEIDPDLPPGPSSPLASTSSLAASTSLQRPMTPSRSLHLHSRTSSHNSNASLRTPPHSRPTSRAGRPSTGSAHPLASRSALLAPDEDRVASNFARRATSLARDSTTSSLISPSPASAALRAPASVVPSVAAFLEDQVQDQDAASSSSDFASQGATESPTRCTRSNLGLVNSIDLSPRGDSPFSPDQVRFITDKALSSSTGNVADVDEIDVSTPRARPTTHNNFNIGIAGTIFRHDDDITDHEGHSSINYKAASTRSSGLFSRDDTSSARMAVPLEKRRMQLALDEADGEQTPTKANALARRQTLQTNEQGLTAELSTQAWIVRDKQDKEEPEIRAAQAEVQTLPEKAGGTAEAVFAKDRYTEQVTDEPEETDSVGQVEKKSDGDEAENADEQAEAEEDEGGVRKADEEDEDEEEEDDEEEDEEEEDDDDEEEEEDDDDEDDLALEALDLEGY
ncbi:hypothetical protein NDA18_003629 [Ustilago nuda]|nr:hypothetical protein NDA18_003629 [Ustilago nuda]